MRHYGGSAAYKADSDAFLGETLREGRMLFAIGTCHT
jgi:hypothetical protein